MKKTLINVNPLKIQVSCMDSWSNEHVLMLGMKA